MGEEVEQKFFRIAARGLTAGFVLAAFVSCSATTATIPPLVWQGIDESQMDERALEECKPGDATLVAAIDSSSTALRDANVEHPWDEEFDDNLSAEDIYVAVCVVDASTVPALSNDLSYFAIWQADMEGSGVLGGW
ncbi:protocatechuate 3,4-dioxygenase beta subunit [Agromyces cerinus]|uniref:hypothetical protein n=1 Tax=Agromyces cerinus TaxID=33878 RepID=UPI001958EE33|nr:hypothetical protein [Agromyces cerinus]MBM7830279.1 protocatechuate 3,4-dioxygenase beta subunit [Agromyces cerinus]